MEPQAYERGSGRAPPGLASRPKEGQEKSSASNASWLTKVDQVSPSFTKPLMPTQEALTIQETLSQAHTTTAAAAAATAGALTRLRGSAYTNYYPFH